MAFILVCFSALRVAEVLHDEADGLGGEELGAGRLVTVLEGLAEVGTAAYPGVQAVQRHMGSAGIGEVEHGQLALGITFDGHSHY